MAGHGGKREGAGRKSTKHEYVDDGKLSPLQYMLETLRDTNHPPAVRMDAAKAAAPYCSARLLATTLDVEGDISIQLLSQLDQISHDPTD